METTLGRTSAATSSTLDRDETDWLEAAEEPSRLLSVVELDPVAWSLSSTVTTPAPAAPPRRPAPRTSATRNALPRLGFDGVGSGWRYTGWVSSTRGAHGSYCSDGRRVGCPSGPGDDQPV